MTGDIVTPRVPATPAAPVVLPLMSAAEVARVREGEKRALELPQVHIPTDHVFHAGMYARTIMIPAGVEITGALIKIPTLMILSGDAIVYAGNNEHSGRYAGYHVFLGLPGRKQAFLALMDTWLTMIFPTDADDVDAAEREFTEEFEILGSRRGRAPCRGI